MKTLLSFVVAGLTLVSAFAQGTSSTEAAGVPLRRVMASVQPLTATSNELDQTIGFYTPLAEFAGWLHANSTVVALTGDHLFGDFFLTEPWDVAVYFPGTATEPETYFLVFGPVISVVLGPPYVTIQYEADFYLSEGQRQLLLGGKAEILLVTFISAGTNLQPQVVRGPLLPVDSDHDGVPDYLDQCPGTAPGAVVDAHGCSIEQLSPCDGEWKNHGEYVSQVRDVTHQFERAGLMTPADARFVIEAAARSDCGKRYEPEARHDR